MFFNFYQREAKNENFNEINLNAPVFECDKNTLGVIDVKFNNQGNCIAIISPFF